MEKEDSRKQTREALHERRKQVIRMHRKGMPVMRIVELSGLSWYAVNAAIKRYLEAGASALKPEARGKKQGSGRALSEAQEATVRQIICDKRPEQLKMEFALWSRAAVMQRSNANVESASLCAALATISNAGALPRKSRSRRRMSNALKPCKNGWTKTTRRLNSAPRQINSNCDRTLPTQAASSFLIALP